MRKTWTKEELEYLMVNYSKLSNSKIGEVLKRSASSIETKGMCLGLKKDPTNRTMSMKWTDDDVQFLVDNYSSMTNKELSEHLGRSPKTILNRAGKLGLKKSKEHIHKISLARKPKAEPKVVDFKYKCGCDGCNGGADSLKGLAIHLSKVHVGLSHEEYYLYYKLGEMSKCIYCGKNAEFKSIHQGYSNKCASKECLSKSRASGTEEWHMLNKGHTDDLEVQKNKRLESLKLGDAIRLEEDPNYYKNKSHNSYMYWMKKGYDKDHAKMMAQQVVENMQKVSREVREEDPEKYAYCYNTKIEYYLEKGMSEEQAEEALIERQTTFSLEKCIDKYGDEEGTKVWLERQTKWIKTMDDKSDEEKAEIYKRKILNSKSHSKVSMKLFDDIYDKIKDDFEKIYYGNLINEYFIYDRDKKRYFLYDFVVKDTKKCIEFNGWYWHCKPSLYEADFYNMNKKMYAKEIWEFDAYKNNLIEKNGFEVLVVWEDDFKNSPKEVIEKCINFLYN